MPKNPMYLGKVEADTLTITDIINTNSNYLNIPQVSGALTPVAKAENATLTTTEASGIVTNTGASGTIVLTLPASAIMAGVCMKVQITVAQVVRIDPAGTEGLFLGGSGVAGKYLNIAAVIGNYADLYCDGSRWIVTGYSGVLTKEA
jgi:hypothetical protein